MDSPAQKILKRVGIVLVAIGIVDIGYMIYCITNNMSYSSSFNVFAVWFGVLMIRGSLWAASKVRFFITIFLASGIGLVFVMPFFQPISLTLVELHHLSLLNIILPTITVILSSWIVVQLNKKPVMDAFNDAGRKVWPPQIPIIMGVCLAIAASLAMTLMVNTQKAVHARELALAKLGSGYQYYVHSMQVRTINHHTSVAAVVTAWDDKNDEQEIPVAWEENSQ